MLLQVLYRFAEFSASSHSDFTKSYKKILILISRTDEYLDNSLYLSLQKEKTKDLKSPDTCSEQCLVDREWCWCVVRVQLLKAQGLARANVLSSTSAACTVRHQAKVRQTWGQRHRCQRAEI